MTWLAAARTHAAVFEGLGRKKRKNLRHGHSKERWPLCSQLIAENRIPEFDNLYLDTNGIIHNSSHDDSMGATHRIHEETIFLNIFSYIEHLYATIKPSKLFFIAIDGVAPRAKMNQQRSRRFRTAKDAEDAKKKAEANGEEMPKEPPFDSNCITPGTSFMRKLSQQLEYFIAKKISEDQTWQGVQIVLSGHEVPGEGEHKIMEYIRQAKAQPDYDANTRHCLYGLDADLIMLGLLSHDSHFCLLREEVTFGSTKRRTKDKEYDAQTNHRSLLTISLASQNFFLLHLCILREYLELEFSDLQQLSLSFAYDLEHIIDDFILLAFFVGNDFLPHLPNLHINEGALAQMFEAYKRVLPNIDGYINENGSINIVRLGKLLLELEHLEYKAFEQEQSDTQYLREKSEALVKDAVSSNTASSDSAIGESMLEKLGRRRKKKTSSVAKALGNRQPSEFKQLYEERFSQWKDKYYREKFGFSIEDEINIREVAENYVQGLQWVLYYYYKGVASWGWFYKFHYAPRTTDIRLGLNANCNFEKGTPFKPFEQLMGVLPDRSQQLIPTAFRDLMYKTDSPIIDFYPRDFRLDMNGKKQEWEAVVLIPFIDEKRLLEAMEPRNQFLSAEEKARNNFGPLKSFNYDPEYDYTYPSSLPAVLPSLAHCHCRIEDYDLPNIYGLSLVDGLADGAKLGVKAMAGFPSLHTLPHKGHLEYHSVVVFQQESRDQTMVISIENSQQGKTIAQIAKEKIGHRVFVNWPYLVEAKVIAVSDEKGRYDRVEINRHPELIFTSHGPADMENWKRSASRIANTYSKRVGVVTGQIHLLLHVALIKGMRQNDDGSVVKEFFECPVGQESEYALQMVVHEVYSEDGRYVEQAPVDLVAEFPEGTRAFFLGEFNYGRPLEVVKHRDGKLDIWLSTMKKEPIFSKQCVKEEELRNKYYPSFAVSKTVGLSGLALSKITSSFTVIVSKDQRANLGLNLKFDAKGQKVIGYTRKSDFGWEYSDRAVKLIRDYSTKFPDFFAKLDTLAKERTLKSADFYPESIADAKVQEIEKWLKSVEARSMKRVPLNEESLDYMAIANIEKVLENIVNNEKPHEPKLIKGVPRSAVLKPQHAINRLQNQIFALGDRVVYVLDSGKVPIALKGVVVAVQSSTVDVVFDIAFMSGTSLSGRCSPHRGMAVLKGAVLNLSNPQIVTPRQNRTKLKRENLNNKEL